MGRMNNEAMQNDSLVSQNRHSMHVPLDYAIFWRVFSFQLDLVMSEEEGDTSSFIPNGEWDLLGKLNRSYAPSNFSSICY